MTDLPEDIKREWLSLLRRLQSISKSNGYSVIKIAVLVDDAGTPVAWTEPVQVKLEPKSAVAMMLLLGLQQK